MNHAVVTAFTILIVMGAVVHKSESYIRAGRGMVYNKQGEPLQFPQDYNDRLAEARRSPKFFKKG